MHSFKCYWDYEKDWLVIKLPDGQEKCYSKEMLEDATAMAFVHNVLMHVSKQYHDKSKYYEAQYMNQPQAAPPPKQEMATASQYMNALLDGTFKPPKKGETIASLCLPHIRQIWHNHTGGSVNNLYYDHSTETFNLVMSQGFVLCLPKMIFEDEKYAHIDMILGWLSNNWKSLKHISGYDYSIDKDTCYELGLIWPKLNNVIDNVAKPSQVAPCGCPACKPVKELHVYDLGDGMLVPCQLAHEIAEWIKPHNDWWMSQEMIEDDLYGAPVMAAIKDTAAKIDKAILENAMSLFPGKVFIVDDLVDAIQYMTDPNEFFLANAESEKFDFISTPYMTKDLMHALLYGQPMKLQAEPATVAIPKKPAQITKQSLEYFHKILGGKKDPYIK